MLGSVWLYIPKIRRREIVPNRRAEGPLAEEEQEGAHRLTFLSGLNLEGGEALKFRLRFLNS